MADSPSRPKMPSTTRASTGATRASLHTAAVPTDALQQLQRRPCMLHWGAHGARRASSISPSKMPRAGDDSGYVPMLLPPPATSLATGRPLAASRVASHLYSHVVYILKECR